MVQSVYLCEGVRSPIGRYGGALSSVRPDDLLSQALCALRDKIPDCDLSSIDDCIIGCANQSGEDNRNIARMSILLSGYPLSIGGVTLNRLCGSGLDSVVQSFRSIATGEMDLVIAGGVESMSRAPYVLSKPTTSYDRTQKLYDTTMGWRFINSVLQAQYGTDSMPETAENLASDHNISREDQDKFALWSQSKALAARDSGRLSCEIFPVEVTDSKGTKTSVDTDEHPRSTSLSQLSKLPTPFRENGSVTAGNASGLNDGSSVVLLASESAIKRHNLTPKARIIASTVAGVEPRIMGIGPVPAIEKLLEKTSWQLPQVDLLEINEAFAAQVLAVLRSLSLPDDDPRLNPHGGAIALGHPLGMSGTRLALTAATTLSQTDSQKAICAMCIGVGQGISLAMESV